MNGALVGFEADDDARARRALDPSVSIVTQLLARQISDWAVWTWFASPNTWLDGVAPRAALRAGDVAAVRKAAARLFEE